MSLSHFDKCNLRLLIHIFIYNFDHNAIKILLFELYTSLFVKATLFCALSRSVDSAFTTDL